MNIIFLPPNRTVPPYTQVRSPEADTSHYHSDRDRFLSLRIADETELGFFKLQCVHIFLWIDLSCIEQKVVGRNTEQRLGEFFDFRKQKVLDVLTCQNK